MTGCPIIDRIPQQQYPPGLLQTVHPVGMNERIPGDGGDEELEEDDHLRRTQVVYRLRGAAKGQPLGEQVDLSDDRQLFEQGEVGRLPFQTEHQGAVIGQFVVSGCSEQRVPEDPRGIQCIANGQQCTCSTQFDSDSSRLQTF